MTTDATQPRPTRATRGALAVLLVPGLPDVDLALVLRYDVSDPWAVRMVLLPGEDGDESVEWVFARSLLTEGLTTPVGDGDVRVRVVGREAHVELAGAATVVLALEALVGFLTDTYSVVPTGAEADVVASAGVVEAMLARLLGD